MSLPNEFMVVGSEEMLKPLILQLLADHFRGRGISDSSQVIEHEWHPGFKKRIKIKLKFFGYTTQYKKPKEVENSIRLMNIDSTTVTFQSIHQLAQKVHQKFNNWTHQLGKVSCNYIRREQGYQLQQIYVSSVQEGKRLIEQILDIQGHSPDWRYLTYNQSGEPEEAFDETPDKEIIAGYSIRKPQKRPLGTVSFSKALIHFPTTPSYEFLCDRQGNLIKSLDFLKEMADND